MKTQGKICFGEEKIEKTGKLNVGLTVLNMTRYNLTFF